MNTIKFKWLLFLGIFVTMLSFQSCKKEMDCCMMIDATLLLSILDENGNDLLDPEKEYAKSVDLSKLKIAYVIADEEKIITNGFRVIEPEGEHKTYSLLISLNETEKESTPKTLLKWNASDIDVLESTFARTNNNTSISCTKVELNGELVWDVHTANSHRYVEIIK